MNATLSSRGDRHAALVDPWRSHAVRVEGITDEAPGVRTYELVFLDASVAASFQFAAGQFNMLYLPGIGEAAISISSDARRPSQLSHTVRAVGNVTHALARFGVGDTLMIRGPFGRPWPMSALRGREVVVVAGGLGLASQRTAIYELAGRREMQASVTVIHGAKRPSGLLYTGEYQAWRSAGIAIETIVDGLDPGDSWSGDVGVVTDLFTRLQIDPSRTTVLCCGPDAMMVAVAREAIARGIAATDVFLSLERNMACAVRHCGLCQFGPLFVCHDGPVFPYHVIEPFLAVSQM